MENCTEKSQAMLVWLESRKLRSMLLLRGKGAAHVFCSRNYTEPHASHAQLFDLCMRGVGQRSFVSGGSRRKH